MSTQTQEKIDGHIVYFSEKYDQEVYDIIRKEPCEKCQSEMTMTIMAIDGNGSGTYQCVCGHCADQDQDEDDWQNEEYEK